MLELQVANPDHDPAAHFKLKLFRYDKIALKYNRNMIIIIINRTLKILMLVYIGFVLCVSWI